MEINEIFAENDRKMYARIRKNVFFRVRLLDLIQIETRSQCKYRTKFVAKNDKHYLFRRGVSYTTSRYVSAVREIFTG